MFITRPNFEDRQVVQYSGTSITLSGETNINNTGYLSIEPTILDFTGTTTASTIYNISGLSGYVNNGEISSFIVKPPILLQSGTTATTSVNITGYVLTSLDQEGRVVWSPSTGGGSFTGNTSGDCISNFWVSNIHSCSPLNINPNDEGDVYFGSTSAVTIDLTNNRIGINKTNPISTLDVNGDLNFNYRNSRLFLTDNNTTSGRLVISGDSNNLQEISVETPMNVGPSTGGGVSMGVRGFTSSNTLVGSPLDTFIYSSFEMNGLNIFKASSGSYPNNPNYIRFYAGNVATSPPHMHIQGSGSTKGFIGINTITPTSRLHVVGSLTLQDGNEQNGYVLTSNSTGLASWQPAGGGSFTGNTSGDCINDLYVSNIHGCSPITLHDQIQYEGSTATTKYSVALGLGNTASGNYSVVSGGFGNISSSNWSTIGGGRNNTSSGYYSTIGGGRNNISSGSGSTVSGGYGNISSGNWSTIGGGFNNTSTGLFSTVVGGRNNTASGSASHAEGQDTTSSGQRSHAEGSSTIASGFASHAEGAEATIASGFASHAEGLASVASGSISHAEGQNSIAEGASSHAQNSRTRAIGFGSHSQNYGNISYGFASTTTGNHNFSAADYDVTNGSFNISSADRLLGYNNSGKYYDGNIYELYLVDDVTSLFTTGDTIYWYHSDDQRYYRSTINLLSYDSLNNYSTLTLDNAIGSTDFSSYFVRPFAISNIRPQGVDSSSFMSGYYNTNNSAYSNIVGGLFNENYSNYSNIIGGTGNTINSGLQNVTIIGGNGITGTTSNMVYVPDLSIKKTSPIPTTSGDTVGDVGMITWDNNYLYVKTNIGWGRINLSYTF
jgi:hypothetical protein